MSTITARLENADRDTRLVSGAIATTVAATVLAFIVAPGLTTYPLVAFLVVTAYGWYAHQEETARALMFVMTASTVVILALITIYLVVRSIPAFRIMGIEIVFKTSEPFWAPSRKLYSLVPMMWGTLITTLLAMCIAAPLGVAGALFISEIAPAWAREILKPAVETLAGIPSIVYGFLAFVVINPYMMDELSVSTYGSLFAVGVVIGVMSLPTVVSVAEDAIGSVPGTMKDGSLALGATNWQTMTDVTIPAAFSGVSAAVLLGVGRAVGETMAATVILGHAQQLPEPLYNVFGNTETLTSLIASQYGIASGTHLSALFAAGVVLFVTVLVISIASQRIEARMREKLGGEV